jgi:hypothetical protein
VTVPEYSLIRTRFSRESALWTVHGRTFTLDEHALLRSLQSGGKHADPS